MDNEPQNGQPPERQIDPICQPQQNMAESPAAQNYQVVEQPKQKIKIWKIILSIALPLFVCASVVFVLTATSKKTDDVVKLDTSKAADAAKLDTSKATDAGIQYVADANNQFAFELYNEIAKSEKSNICLLYTSPSPRD